MFIHDDTTDRLYRYIRHTNPNLFGVVLVLCFRTIRLYLWADILFRRIDFQAFANYKRNRSTPPFLNNLEVRRSSAILRILLYTG